MNTLTDPKAHDFMLKGDLHLVLNGALVSPDQDVPMPNKNSKTSSFSAQVQDLEVNQSACRVHRANPDMTLAEFTENLRDIKEMMRNNVASTMKLARQKTGGTYSSEVSEVVMPSGSIFVLLIITRTA